MTDAKPSRSSLTVLVDGTPLPEAEARAFWERFSAHMEAHRGDLRGFAEAEGFASVHPQMGPGGATLVASRTAPQQPYRNVSKEGSAGGGGPKPPSGGASGGRDQRAGSGRPAGGSGPRPEGNKAGGPRGPGSGHAAGKPSGRRGGGPRGPGRPQG